MRLSKKSEYACLSMIDLAERFDAGEYVKVMDICGRRKIPRKYLEQILLQLKRGGFLHSSRGAEGGYKLSRPPGKITLAEVIRLMDGALAPVGSVSTYFYEHTPIEQHPPLIGLLKDIRDYIATKLETTTFADMI